MDWHDGQLGFNVGPLVRQGLSLSWTLVHAFSHLPLTGLPCQADTGEEDVLRPDLI